MIHLSSYNESAGKLYRQVDENEIIRHMAGQQSDNFTTGELQVISDIVEGTGRKVEVTESMGDMDKFTFNRGDKIRIYGFGWDNDNRLSILSPDMPYHLSIWDEGLSKQNPMVMRIVKSSDDWFYVKVKVFTQVAAWVICDGVAGLKSMLTDLFKKREQ